MLDYLSQYILDWAHGTEWGSRLSFLRLFHYITVRSAGAAVTSLMLCWWFGPRVIRWLNSLSWGRPVSELLWERRALSLRSTLAGLALAWVLALGAVTALELSHRGFGEGLAAILAGALLCTPAALLALACVYIGAGSAAAIAAIVFPRVFRYLRDLVRQAGAAPHVLTAHALGVHPLRILACHAAPPVLPELLALGGISVSMAIGSMVPVEALCDSPGVGQLVWQAALAHV